MLSGYLLCIIGTTLVSSILLAILPEGKSSSMVKGMAKLVCIVSIVSPIPKLIGQETFLELFQSQTTEKNSQQFTESVINTDEVFIDYVSELRIENACWTIERQIYLKFDIECNVRVDCVILSETAKMQLNSIYLQSSSTINAKTAEEIIAYLKEIYLCEVQLE